MTKTDKLIFWGVLIFSALFLLCSNVILAKTGEKTVTVEVEGKHYASYSTESLTEPKVLKIETSHGNQEIRITKEKTEIVYSSCKDGLCLGEIKNPGEMLVCLPNRIVVRMEASGEVDRVAY